MQVSLVITILGPDRPGLVKSLSETLKQFNANWTDSRMSRLAGRFAGILHVCVADDQLDALSDALENLHNSSLQVQIEKTHDMEDQAVTQTLRLELLAQDRSGIVLDITQQLETLKVNIEELESEVKEASMSGGTLFIAKLKLGLPEGVTPEAVQDSLESMADQFMVDLNFSS